MLSVAGRRQHTCTNGAQRVWDVFAMVWKRAPASIGCFRCSTGSSLLSTNTIASPLLLFHRKPGLQPFSEQRETMNTAARPNRLTRHREITFRSIFPGSLRGEKQLGGASICNAGSALPNHRREKQEKSPFGPIPSKRAPGSYQIPDAVITVDYGGDVTVGLIKAVGTTCCSLGCGQ